MNAQLLTQLEIVDPVPPDVLIALAGLTRLQHLKVLSPLLQCLAESLAHRVRSPFPRLKLFFAPAQPSVASRALCHIQRVSYLVLGFIGCENIQLSQLTAFHKLVLFSLSFKNAVNEQVNPG